MFDDTSNARTARRPAVGELVDGVRRRDRALLARAITLLESTCARESAMGQEVLQAVLSGAGQSRRIGITGVPGVGKSTFIEAIGCRLCATGHRVAVLAIDPSSSLSHGSILGDRTRMERLSREANAFIRPSPSGGVLGGVGRRTRESVLLCEAAGFDVILVETVGVGQAEIVLRSLVDFFVLLLLPGAGDALQGIKRGIMEMADAVLINKADGEDRPRAEAMRAEQAMALRNLLPITPGWRTHVGICSALTGDGVAEFWSVAEAFFRTGAGDEIEVRRREQDREWFLDLVREELLDRFFRHPAVVRQRPLLEQAVAEGVMTPGRAAAELLAAHDGATAGGSTRAEEATVGKPVYHGTTMPC